ncbi:hypothetical protein Back11_12150 [Paenibacillus baekrokdamisoli]|uniref:Uncharacterized protein n=1 Tax=Paenibacillus baekrokdamisoli TaxID=1712516 RepID=A0A3G9IM07_9BACL|nr:hypothetical protein Back11_12150 [Paenibacillus baekrokdamisoli]
MSEVAVKLLEYILDDGDEEPNIFDKADWIAVVPSVEQFTTHTYKYELLEELVNTANAPIPSIGITHK